MQHISKTRSQNGVLCNLLGHSSVIATEKTYAKLLPKMLDVASKIKLPASYRQVKLCPRRDALHIPWCGIRIKRFDESLTNSLLDES